MRIGETSAVDVAKQTDNIDNSSILLDSSPSKPIQTHHYATDKNKTYTQQFSSIAQRYGLNLDGEWNKDALPHSGRHSNEYHEFVLDSMLQADEIANGDVDVFLEMYKAMVKDIVKDNPEMLYKNYWINLGD